MNDTGHIRLGIVGAAGTGKVLWQKDCLLDWESPI
jgi:hypothetical protein